MNAFGGLLLNENINQNNSKGEALGYMMIGFGCVGLIYSGLVAGCTRFQSRREIHDLRNAGYGDIEMSAIAPSNQVNEPSSPHNNLTPKNASQLSASAVIDNSHTI